MNSFNSLTSKNILLVRGTQFKLNGVRKNFFRLIEGTKLISFTHTKDFLRKKQNKFTNFWASGVWLKASAGHIWQAGRMLWMPAVAHSRWVELPSSKWFRSMGRRNRWVDSSCRVRWSPGDKMLNISFHFISFKILCLISLHSILQFKNLRFIY
jgi:hypothetical protein